jgi:hypothetical protein
VPQEWHSTLERVVVFAPPLRSRILVRHFQGEFPDAGYPGLKPRAAMSRPFGTKSHGPWFGYCKEGQNDDEVPSLADQPTIDLIHSGAKKRMRFNLSTGDQHSFLLTPLPQPEK